MKAFLYIFLVLLVFAAGVWILNSFGVVSVKAWGETMITNTPFLKNYVQTNQKYSQAASELQQLQNQYNQLQENHNKLQTEYKSAEKTIADQQQQLSQLKSKLADLQNQQMTEEEKLNKLVKIYGQMAAKDAARIFVSLDDQLVIRLLKNLPEEQSADILTALPAEDAARYSKAINQ